MDSKLDYNIGNNIGKMVSSIEIKGLSSRASETGDPYH